MTQIATVQRVLNDSYAEIAVPRKSACGHDCEECAGCGISGASVYARAKNPIGAKPGQKVVVESSSQKLLGIVTLVYFTPVVLFFLGYFLGFWLSPNSGISYVAGALGFILGIVIAIFYDRHMKRQGGLSFTIVRLF